MILAFLLTAAVAAAPVPRARAPYIGAASAEVSSGRTIFADGADSPAYPSSVTKLMTAYLVLDDVKSGKYKLTDFVTATPDVRFSEASWVGLAAGDRMSVGDMLMALMGHSANDVAVALAVHSSGSLAGFVARMNGKAAELGMKGTAYYNPNGLPPKRKYPWKNHNVTTANDQLKLALALMKTHPEILQFTSVKTCDLVRTAIGFRTSVTRRVNEPQKPTALAEGEKTVMQLRNHNNVMVKDRLKVHDASGREVVDGLKTGYTDAGGSSVVMTGQKGDKRVVVVVLGSGPRKDAKGRVQMKSADVRDTNARKLLEDALGSVSW